MSNQITEDVEHLLKNEFDDLLVHIRANDLTNNIRLLNNAEKILDFG